MAKAKPTKNSAPTAPEAARPKKGPETERLIRHLARRDKKTLAWAAHRVYRRLTADELDALGREADEAEKSEEEAANKPKSP